MHDTSDHRNYGEETPLNPKGENHYAIENHQNCEKISQENSKELSCQGEAFEEKEEASVQQKKADAEEGVGVEEKGKTTDSIFGEGGEEVHDAINNGKKSEMKESQYSCSYTPPYYVPNFTVVSPQTKAPKKKKNKSIGLICAVLVLSILLAFCLGGLLGYRFLDWRNQFLSKYPENVTVIKNDGSIKVNEKVGSTGYSNLSVSEVVDVVADSVVEITTSQVTTDIYYNSYVTSGAGSGVLIGENESQTVSYIITNYHVIDGADKIIVRLRSGIEYEATALCGDADFDIAVLTISVAGLSYATLGSSESLQVGDEVVAIGNPLGQLGGTVTDGIISALDRDVIIDNHRMTLLQTNAAINPGNSGGGLFNMAGELIGIVNAKQSQTGIEGLGFAIPIDVAWNAAEDMIEHGYVLGKLMLGFEIEVQTESFKRTDGYSVYTFPAGIYIVESEQNDLKNYDRIVSINGNDISDIHDYYDALDELKQGDTMTVVVSRLTTNGGYYSFKDVTVKLTVEVTEAPDSAS